MTRAKKQRPRFLSRILFLDILSDPEIRPMLIYVSIIIFIGAMLFHWLEGWSWIDAVYFVVITLTTIGYGDFTPTTPLTKVITIFYGVNGIVILLTFFDVIRRYRHLEIADKGVDG